MRHALVTLAVLIFTTSSFATSPAAPEHSKPVITQELFPVIPGTLDEMFATSDEVLEVEILTSVARAVGDSNKQFARTFYTAKVLRTRKGATRGQVVFTQSGGDVEFPDHVLHASGEPLKVGDRYVVFLRLNERFGGRMLVGDRSGAFKIANGRIEPQGLGKVADEQRNLTERSFGDELDRLSKRLMQKK
jgi:hypothetical protein